MSKADEFEALPFELVVDEDDIIGINGAAEIGYWARENHALIARALRRNHCVENPLEDVSLKDTCLEFIVADAIQDGIVADEPYTKIAGRILAAFREAVK